MVHLFTGSELKYFDSVGAQALMLSWYLSEELVNGDGSFVGMPKYFDSVGAQVLMLSWWLGA